MPVSEISKTKKTKQDQKSRKRRRERRQREQRQRRDRNVARRFGPAEKVHFIHKLKYRVILVRTGVKNKNKRYADISRLVQSISWDEEGIILTGSVSVKAPKLTENEDKGFVARDGNIIKLDGWWGGRWRNIFRMRVKVPEENIGAREGTFTLADDAELVQMSKGDFKFKKNKNHPKGWKCHQVAIQTGRQFKFPLGHIAKGKKDITGLVEHGASPLDVVAKAYKEERQYTGRRFIFNWRHGKLQINKLRRNELLYVLKEQILDAAVQRERGESFFTALQLTANTKKSDRKHKKLEATVVHHRAARRYGYIIRPHRLKRVVKSRQEMVTLGRRILARSIRKHTLPTISVTHTGIPWIRRGDAIEIDLPRYGFTHKLRPSPPFDGGSYNIVFVTKGHHSITSSGYMMQLEFGITDPIAEQKQDERNARDRRRRANKRKQRNAA